MSVSTYRGESAVERWPLHVMEVPTVEYKLF